MKNLIAVSIFLLGIMFFTHGLYARLAPEIPEIHTPVVIELFTSQSCSSCPPADKILSQLAAQEKVIALGCHVSYWNHLQWQDQLAHEFCDIRQHGYSAYSGTKKIYTPQMVVNGEHIFIGSKVEILKNALKRTENAPIKPIQIETIPNTIISYSLPKLPRTNYRLWAFGFKHTQNQDISEGENRGLKVNYANPVASYTNLGNWNGEPSIFQFEKPSEDIDAIAIIVQEGGYGKIVAAGKLNF